MKPIISKLFSEGDFYLKEAKSMFFIKKEEQHKAAFASCSAVKKYLDAYEEFLFEHAHQTENYHVMLHLILQEDPGFKVFSEKIYEIKCFAEESKRQQDGFFLFADEINDVINIIFEIREYVAAKIGIQNEFLADHFESSMMST